MAIRVKVSNIYVYFSLSYKILNPKPYYIFSGKCAFGLRVTENSFVEGDVTVSVRGSKEGL